VFAALAAPAALRADPASAADRATPAASDSAKRASGHTLDAELRFRASSARHLNTLQASQEDLLRGVFQRIRAGARYSAASLDARVQFQTAGSLGAPVRFEPGANDTPVPVPVGLQQGWMRWRPESLDGLEVQVGRMALEFGAGRRIGRYDFHETGNAFDGIRAGYRLQPYLKADLLAVRLRRNTAQPERERYLAGVYLAARPAEPLALDLYFLDLSDGDDDLRADHMNMGLRALWKPVYWLALEGEAAVQFGAVLPKGHEQEMDHVASSVAFAVRSEGHVGIPLAVALRFQRHSGDIDAKDDQSNAWRPLYPSLARHVGLLQLFPQSNLLQYGVGLRIGRKKELHMALDWRVNAAMAGSVVEAFGKPKLEHDDTWAPLGTEVDAAVRLPFASGSELLAVAAVFVPSQLLADAVGQEWAHQLILQWSARF